jgi:TetR/AcrR family transcriptional regulator, transcriptional repressor for nem operon
MGDGEAAGDEASNAAPEPSNAAPEPASSARRAPRRNDPAGLRRKVLDIADAIFQERGYHAASLADVVAAAGVTGGALHHHFASKKALGLAVVWERVAPEVERTWAETMAAAPNARAGVRQVFLDVAEALERQGFVKGCPLNNLALELSLADPEFRAAVAGIFQAWRVLIARRFKDDQRVGREDARADAQVFAARAIATYSGAMAMAKAAQEPSYLRICAP